MYKVYLFRQTDRLSAAWLDQALASLPRERREKAMRYRLESDRKNCAISYLLLRYALKECFGITEFRIGFGRCGKPFLEQFPDIYFNISHCCRGCAVAVSDEPVGVDIQEIRPFSWKVAERVCCAQELCILEKSNCRERDFIRMWAIKESYVKRIGIGIGYPFWKVDTTSVKGVMSAEFLDFMVAVSVG